MIKTIRIIEKLLNRVPEGYKNILFEFVLNYLPLWLIKKIPCSYSTYLKCYFPKKGDIIIDCGAHIGNNTILFSRCVGEKGLVVALEPFEGSFEILKKRIKGGRYKKRRIIAINKGVWNKNGEMILEVFSNTISCRTIENESLLLEKDKYINIGCVTIDELINKLNLERIDMIKMDIEGAEIEALEGSKNALKQYKPHVAIASYHLRGEQQTFHRVEKILQHQGYHVKTFFPPHLTTCGKVI